MPRRQEGILETDICETEVRRGRVYGETLIFAGQQLLSLSLHVRRRPNEALYINCDQLMLTASHTESNGQTGAIVD
jgi:hypothetical protein